MLLHLVRIVTSMLLVEYTMTTECAMGNVVAAEMNGAIDCT
jgi:hypothetical protein